MSDRCAGLPIPDGDDTIAAALVVGAFAGLLLGALPGVALTVLRRGGRKTALPFGPFMLLGAWIGIVGGAAVASWYLRLVGLG